MGNEEKVIHENYFSSHESFHMARYEWIKKRYFTKVRNKKILEIGCGDGGVVQLLKGENKVFGIDISASGVQNARNLGINTKLVDISSEKLPFRNQSFDYVLIFEVFEHLKCPQCALEEIQRVLKPKGVMLASIPNHTTGHEFLYPKLFLFNAFKNYLEHNGFKIEEEAPYGYSLGFLNKFIYKNKTGKQKAGEKVQSNSLISKIRQIFHGDLAIKLKPKNLCWLMVYKARNDSPLQTKYIYKEIAKTTSRAY